MQTKEDRPVNEIIMFVLIFVPIIDIQSGVLLLLSTLITIYLAIKLFEKNIILKTFFFLILVSSFFKLVSTLESDNDLTVYLTSTGLGIFILIIMASLTKWDDENNHYPHKQLF